MLFCSYVIITYYYIIITYYYIVIMSIMMHNVYY